MQYMDAALRKIMHEYDEERTAARARREETVEKVHRELPQIKEIEDEINRLGMENFGKIIKNPEKSREYNEEFEKKLAALNAKKAEILSKNGVPLDYNEVKYKCEKCLDTGYEDTKKCSCFIQKIINLRYDMSNMKEILHDFDEFSFDYYSDKYIESLDMTEKENIKIIFEKAKDFCVNDEAKSLFFYGGCGFGKTFLSSCIAKKMMDDGKIVIYTSASSLFSDYEDYKFGKKPSEEFVLKREMMKEAELLIIDDLGTEVISAFSVQLLNEILTERIALKKKIIISTNMNMKGISAKYSDRIASRIYEAFEILHFVGTDIRVQKLINKSE
ncbi:MAG: ATP-binding protein [Clostridia bacterium]|nr:ATP-binding protein [Clostridia bacterium]